MRSLLAAFLITTLPLLADSTEAGKLNKVIAEEWQWQLRDDPESATFIGERGHDDRLTDRSAAAWQRRREHNRETLVRIEAIKRAKLGAEDQLNYDLFLLQAKLAVEGDRFPYELVPLNQMGGLYSVLGELAQQIPRDTVKDHEN